MKQRKKIDPDERIELSFSQSEKELLVEHTFADSAYWQRFRETLGNKKLVADFTLGELEDIVGYVAAEANHTEDKGLQRKMYALFDRLLKEMEYYDDGMWQTPGTSENRPE